MDGGSERQLTQELKEYIVWLVFNDHRAIKLLPNNKWAAVKPFMFTHAIVVGKIGDMTSYDNRWCFESFEAASQALDEWNGEGEPKGWHRHPMSGRRRPLGNELEEYVNP